MFRLIGLLVVLALGAFLALQWDRHPALGLHLNLIVWHPGFDLPDSLQVQRDKALAASQAAQDATKACRAAIASQNQAVAAQSALSTAALDRAKAETAAVAAQASREAAGATRLHGYVPRGDGELVRWQDAGRAVREGFSR